MSPVIRRRSARPEGQPTRGKTTRNRLRRTDLFLLLNEGPLVRAEGGAYDRAYFVDLGYGAEPFTTLESAERLRAANPRLPVLGVEIDSERVARAVPYAGEGVLFRLGGFNVPLAAGESARIIRAFNVLRQYEEGQVREAWQVMGRTLLPGGVLMEGTSDPFGRLWVANLLRRTGDTLVYEGLLFSTNFRWGFEPRLFQPVLPKNCIHRMLPGEPINDFMDGWHRAARETVAFNEWGLRQWFEASAHALVAQGFRVDGRRKLLRRGFLVWKESPHGDALIPL
ncbi:methylase [Aggregatilinea lenta]|uniref:methylase n=1 Tax=Aggregatilinea lenta TaxID=913108 RepID=UPI000E5A7C4A|nr:methylase [Aggregatilinea lenta]